MNTRRVSSVALAVLLGLFLLGMSPVLKRATELQEPGRSAVTFEMRLAEIQPGPGLTEAALSGSQKTIYLHEDAIVTNGDVARARVVPRPDASGFNLAVDFTPEGARKLSNATKDHSNRPLAILINGTVVAAPTVRGEIGASALVTGDFSKAELDSIAAALTSR